AGFVSRVPHTPQCVPLKWTRPRNRLARAVSPTISPSMIRGAPCWRASHSGTVTLAFLMVITDIFPCRLPCPCSLVLFLLYDGSPERSRVRRNFPGPVLGDG